MLVPAEYDNLFGYFFKKFESNDDSKMTALQIVTDIF